MGGDSAGGEPCRRRSGNLRLRKAPSERKASRCRRPSPEERSRTSARSTPRRIYAELFREPTSNPMPPTSNGHRRRNVPAQRHDHGSGRRRANVAARNGHEPFRERGSRPSGTARARGRRAARRRSSAPVRKADRLGLPATLPLFASFWSTGRTCRHQRLFAPRLGSIAAKIAGAKMELLVSLIGQPGR